MDRLIDLSGRYRTPIIIIININSIRKKMMPMIKKT
jgi:hypothetical protein